MRLKCKICGKEVSTKGLLRHIKLLHDINTTKEYYDKFLKKPDEGICPICGKETIFYGITKGYTTHCGPNCTKADPKVQEKMSLSKIKNGTTADSICVQEKKKKTCLKKYGAISFSKTKEFKEKTEKTCLEKYGIRNVLCTGKLRNEIKEKRLEKNNGHYYSEESKLKMEETKLKRYGTKTYNNRKKSAETCLKKYGYIYPSQVPEIRTKMAYKYLYNGIKFDSGSEICYYIWLKDNKKKFIFQPKKYFEYEYNGELRKYFPDFIVEGKIKEIKGLQFFENKDPNGKMINPYDRTMDDLYEAKHQCMLKNNVEIITDYEVYVKYVEEKYGKNYIEQFKCNNIRKIVDDIGNFPFIKYNEENLLNDWNMKKDGYKIIQHFHESIWKASVGKRKSPYVAWSDKILMEKIISNRLIYKNKTEPETLRQGLNVTKIAPKVSVFKPKTAKHIIKTYLSEYGTVFDPFSGFSGRMLGTCACDKKYIGQDINEEHVKESNEIINFLKLNAKVINKDIFKSEGNYECLFTCPPYGLKEIWNEKETEKTCDGWIDECVTRFKCKRYVFVVDETEKYKDKIVEILENRSHLGINKEYVVML